MRLHGELVQWTAEQPLADFDVPEAEAAASVGAIPFAVDRLQRRRAVAESSARDQIVVRDAERALRKIILAWRLFDDDRSPPLTSSSEALADLLAIRGLDRPTAFEDGDPAAVHASWRASVPDVQELRVAAAAFLSAAIMRVDEPLLALELKLDLQELHLLVGDPECVQLTEPLPGSDPERAYRLQLRATALLGEDASVITPARLGRRRAAAIALDEGTLLALRLPDRARQILQTARELHDAVDDSLGRLFAATQLCMVALRQGHDRQRAIAELADAYARAARVHRLPDWNALRTVRHAALTRNPETDFWRPWLARIIACIAAGELPREQWSGAFAELTRALGRRDLPTELDMLMRAVEPVRSGPSRDPPSAGDTDAATVVAVEATPDPTSFRWTASRGRTAAVRFEPDQRVRFEGHETLLHGLLQSGRPVELRLGAGTHGVPWEELLLPSRLSVCRVNRGAREFASDHSELSSVLILSNDHPTSSVLRRVWDGASMRTGVEGLDSRNVAAPELGRVDVFHLLGEPVEINGAVRLRLDGFEAHLSARQDFGALIDPAALAGRLREVRLCILQGSPIAELRTDLAADVCVYAPSAEALADPRSEPPARDRSGAKDEGLFAFNGLDAAGGGYLLPRMTAEQVVSLAQREDPNRDTRQEAIALHESKSLASFAVREEVDPNDLAEAGWAVIFAHDEDPAIREALAPLLELRKAQASRSEPRRYRELSGSAGYRPGESKSKFLLRQGALAFGAVDPDRMPFHVLIVGDPAKIPFEFQAQLDLQYAVGRLHFDTVDEYASYARTVVAAERGEVRPPRRIGLFGVSNPDDQATALSEERLIHGLHEQLRRAIPPDWMLDVFAGDTARKADLARVIGGPDTPAVLFTASHGAGFPSGDPRQLGHQGALVCQDWPGPRAWPGPLTGDMYFGADDLGDEARLAGLIAFHVASHGAGTPEFEPSFRDRGGGSGRLAPRPFVAALPRRMLAHPRGGALAVVSHVGFAWGFSAPTTSRTGHQLAVFQSVLRRLLDGHPIGSALDLFGARYGELSSDLAVLIEELNYGNRTIQPADIAAIWTEDRDARGFMLLGDPAVRIPR